MLEVGEEDCGQDFSRKEVTIERSSLIGVFEKSCPICSGFICSLLLLLIFIFLISFQSFFAQEKKISNEIMKSFLQGCPGQDETQHSVQSAKKANLYTRRRYIVFTWLN